MRKSVILAFLFFYFLTLNAQTGKELPVMDNYTIPVGIEGVIVGRVIPPEEEIMFLNKDTSELFIFDKQNYIRLKDGVVLSECHPGRYGIEMQFGESTISFELVKDNFLRNGVIANGGAWKNKQLEYNSLEALDEAVEIGCEASRCDVFLNQNRQVELIPESSGANTVLLEECIGFIKTQNKTRLVINLKDISKNKDKALALADSVVQIVHRFRAQAWVEYVSFNYDILLRIRSQDQTALVSYLGNDKSMEAQADDYMSAIESNFNFYLKDHALFEKARELGFTIKVWTVDSPKNMQYFLDNGVNYITTDEPEILLKLVSE